MKSRVVSNGALKDRQLERTGTMDSLPGAETFKPFLMSRMDIYYNVTRVVKLMLELVESCLARSVRGEQKIKSVGLRVLVCHLQLQQILEA